MHKHQQIARAASLAADGTRARLASMGASRAAPADLSLNNGADTPLERIAALHAIRDRHLGVNGAVQSDRLLEGLQSLGHVTTFEASRHLDIYDPRARKLDLLNAGHEILMVWRQVVTEAGERHRVGVYSLDKGKA